MKHGFFLLAALVLPSWALAAGSGAASGAREIANPATPASGRKVVELQELWRLGGDSDGEGEFFGVLTGIVQGPGGDLYLLDTQLAEVKVFTQGGEYVRTIGREGEGPGEFRRPMDLVPLGDKIGVLQPRPPALVMLTPEGDPAGNHPLPVSNERGSMVFGVQTGGGTMVLVGAQMKFDESGMERTQRVVTVDDAGHEQAELYTDTSKVDMANMVIREKDMLGNQIAVAPDGHVLASMDDRYRIDVWSPEGVLDHVIVREFEPYLRSKEEQEEARTLMQRRIMVRGPRQAPTFEVSDRDRAVQWMSANTDGTLWVLNAREVRKAPAGVLGTFDVFDAEGRFVRQMELHGDGDFLEDRFVLIGDRMYVITQFESALAAMRGGSAEEEAEDDGDLVPMEVICYQIGEAPGK